MIELKGLYAAYDGVEVLHGIDARFPKGQVSVLCGPNGCGASVFCATGIGVTGIVTAGCGSTGVAATGAAFCCCACSPRALFRKRCRSN